MTFRNSILRRDHWIATVVCVLVGSTIGVADEPVAKPRKPVDPLAETDDWFWPDPFSHLGSVPDAGKGWHFLKMGGDKTVAKDVGVTEEERETIIDIRKSIEDLDKARRRGKPLSKRNVIWDKAATMARRVIDAERAVRLQQLTIQRITYRAFQRPDVVEHLKLTLPQQQKINEIIKAHADRIRARQGQVSDTLTRFEKTNPAADDVRDLETKLSRERSVYGRASHRKTWDDIYEALTDEQRADFNKLRGPRPPSMKSYLRAFPRMEDIEPPIENELNTWRMDNSGIEYRFRLASKAHSLDVPVLFYLDLRNAEGKHEIGVDLHQSQQHLYVNGDRYRYFGQPWGGTSRLDDKIVTIPFTLTNSWKVEAMGPQLMLPPGVNAVSIELNIWDPPESPRVVKKRSLPPPPSRIRLPPLRLTVELASNVTEGELLHQATLWNCETRGHSTPLTLFSLGKSLKLGVEKHQITNPKSQTNSK